MLQLLAAVAMVSAAAPSESDTLLRQLAETRNFNLGRPMAVGITPGEETVLFLRSPPASGVSSLFAFDVATGGTRELLTPESVIAGAEETLSPEEKARRERMRVSGRGFTSYALSNDGQKVLLTLSGKLYVVERSSGKVTQLNAGAGVIDPRFSPDGKQVAYVRDNDVFRIELTTNKERQVTRGGTPERTHGLAEFVAQEEMYRFTGYWWSPDAKHIAYEEADTSGVEKLNLADPARLEQGAQPFAYPRPGKPNAKVRLFVVPVAGGPAKEVRWDAEKYPYMATVKWPKAGPLTLLVQNRAQTEEVLLAADPRTGQTRPLLVERDDAWLQLDQGFPEWLEDGSGFLWSTERNGASEVELRRADGSLARSLVKPGAGFQMLVNYQPKEDILYFLGGPNPTERYLWRVKGGGEPERVTSGGPALERAVVSARGGLIVVTTEGPTSLRRVYVHRSDGTRLGELPSVAREPPYQPRLELRQVGPERFWTALIRPRNFKPGVKLPVIVEIYGAAYPMVQQSMAMNLTAQWMADHGFLVVKLDGRGTALRGRAWERKIKFGFADVLDDQIAALQALAAEVPEMDLTRVGIEGWSHGGYMSALAALSRPDVFKAAFAGAPVVDWRDYDSYLSERYLGLPAEHPEAYEKNSLLTFAKEDKPIGKLLLVHGTFDDNVFFSHTLKLSDALFRAGKPHEVLPLSGSTHMLADPLMSERVWARLIRHFQENL
ncbi:S9 family peptidase [Archangium lansingense]|uniref:DPP IV N-terminal domain-containing protein n=1 Tax=Archangium lansingense TaxID=2995310 RepID=A0ABT4A812_9BACT|nr:DPP IV N-terminal domain-containing protein [Archangium lansinium]MCY1077806.1 DPP IV N-terminal domain-containing protein [Archangium lansinium]